MDLTGTTALVTGASSGIGSRFAVELAARGADLILVARRLDKLEALRASLLAQHPERSVELITADLADPSAVRRLAEELSGAERRVDVLVNNAGVGSHGPFVSDSADSAVGQIALNCSAAVDLTRHLLPAMIEHRHGLVINVASTAAFQPVATMAVYGATKAFLLSFTEALWAETRGSGVRILALCPGATETEFFTRTVSEFMTRGRETPEQVVATALRAVDGSGPMVVSGLRNALGAVGYRFVPRRLMATLGAIAVH